MHYLYSCLSFLFCVCVLCGAYLFCMRVWFIQKVEKVDPLNVVHSEKKVTALKRLKQDEIVEMLLNNG